MAAARTLSRRTVLLAGGAAMVTAAASPAGAESAADGRKLVVVILRGAMDGLAALPKLDDPDIRAHRSSLVDDDAIALSDGFALHSAMPNLAGLYHAGEAAFAPAVAGPYRERSHFAAQDLLECGGVTRVSNDGWMNRALQRAPQGMSAVSIGPVQPLILRGASTSATSWSPPVLPSASDDTVSRLLELYDGDEMLRTALASGLGADMVAGDVDGMGRGAGRGPAGQYPALMTAAGRFLAAPDGPAIAVVSLDGWDTHAGQNVALNVRFRGLDDAFASLRRELGETWKKTAVVAVSEFGRTVRVNGAQGTDHGTAGLALVAGGAVKGGRLLGDWPGLTPSRLFENRDLAPTLDARSLFKGLLRDHLGWAGADLDQHVFPDSAAAPSLAALV